ncbi:unnamed protein product [Withania somnifera]
MNFLMLRSNQTAASQHSPAREVQSETNHASKPSTTLEGLIAEEPFTESEKYDDKLPDNWSEAPDRSSICSLDRFFVIPGEQVHILACLSACKQDIEIITPFKVVALMNKSGIGQSNQKQNGNKGVNSCSVSNEGAVDDSSVSENSDANIDPETKVSASENLLRLEDYKRQTESLVQRFNSSHFFVRIAESDEPLWSKRKAMEEVSDMITADGSETEKTLKKKLSLSASTDKGNFDARTSGGVARNAVKCCALPNGDIVPIVAGSSVSQIFSFGNFRSYSMSSLPPNIAPPPSVTTSTTGPSFNPEDWEQFSFQKSVKSEKTGSEGLLSFRGVSLEPERFSVRCDGRRKIEIIQPVEITSFAADCNTDDLLCVQIKNVCPAHAPDIVVYADAVTIIFEEASKSGPPLSLPIACTEAGEDYSLPNLSLRSGEEHSFILRPVNPILKSPNGHSGKTFRSSRVHSRSASSTWHPNIEEGNIGTSTDKYAVLVSRRCNYTESKLFFKQPTSWRPRISRDLMISVASEMTKQTLGSFEGGAQLPVQVLTLQALNLASQDLTMTVLAPASFNSPPSVVSLSTWPTSPMSPFIGGSDFMERVSIDKQTSAAPSNSLVSVNQVPEGKKFSQSDSISERDTPIPDVLPSGDLGLTYVPEHSLKINATSSISTGII